MTEISGIPAYNSILEMNGDSFRLNNSRKKKDPGSSFPPSPHSGGVPGLRSSRPPNTNEQLAIEGTSGPLLLCLVGPHYFALDIW